MDHRIRRRQFAAKLREYRKMRGLSQRELGDMAGSGLSYIYELEAAKKSPTLDKLCGIADALGVQVRDLIEF